MSIREKLEADLLTALKAREAGKVSCLRMLKSKMQEREVAQRSNHGKDYRITDEEAQTVIATYAKQRQDSIAGYRQGGREDLVVQEQAELEIVRTYLPQQLGPDEVEALIREAIAESGASSIADMGAVMQVVMPKVKGVADGKMVNQKVRELLAGSSAATEE
jgi:uncharacterized protein YqeY